MKLKFAEGSRTGKKNSAGYVVRAIIRRDTVAAVLFIERNDHPADVTEKHKLDRCKP